MSAVRSSRKSYRELLRDPRWQRCRLKKLESASWRCEHCRRTNTELHVHHPKYVAGRMPWEYENHELLALCVDCHHAEHLPSPSPRDFEVETTIDALYREFLSEKDPVKQRQIWAAYSASIRDRSKTQVARMEAQRGLV